MTPQESIILILDRIPGFIPRWTQYVQEWILDDERPYGLDITEFSNYVCDVISEGKDEEIEQIVVLTEDMFTQGDAKVVRALVYQFLENITNRNDSIPIEQFTKSLKPISKKACLEIDLMWGTKTRGLE